jgi:hypothetical protein
MINGNLEQFLDTGWWNADATIYYDEHVYFFDGFFDDNHNMHLIIRKWKAININNERFENVYDGNGDLIDYEEIEMLASTEEELREQFLKSKIWNGESFWNVENKLAWLD